jgi:hypothetical protein
MTRLLAHARGNAVAYLALFVALGGTSYAAFSLPAGSVGARQIQNRAITPAKFAPESIAASIRAWAQLVWAGAWSVTGSSSDIQVATTARGEMITWRHTRFARNCMASVTPQANFVPGGPGEHGSLDGYVSTLFDGPSGRLQIDGLATDGTHQAQGVTILIVCPSPGSQKLGR